MVFVVARPALLVVIGIAAGDGVLAALAIAFFWGLGRGLRALSFPLRRRGRKKGRHFAERSSAISRGGVDKQAGGGYLRVRNKFENSRQDFARRRVPSSDVTRPGEAPRAARQLELSSTPQLQPSPTHLLLHPLSPRPSSPCTPIRVLPRPSITTVEPPTATLHRRQHVRANRPIAAAAPR